MSEPPKPKTCTTVTVARSDGSTFNEVGSRVHSEVLQRSIEGFVDMGRKKYPRVGHCIYCGETNHLSREHIIPLGLSGNAVLQDASCPACRNITASFEREVLRGSMRAVRVLLKFPSRKKHQGAPLTQGLTFTRDGISHAIDLPIEKFPVVLPLPKFAAPRFFTGVRKSGIDVIGVATISFGPTPEMVAKQLGAQGLVLQPDRDRPASFARMLAKIGYGMAYALGEIDRLSGPSPVIPSILGHANDIGQWVGTLPGPIQKYMHGPLHRIEIHEDKMQQLLVAEVQLFCNSETPSYVVVLGRLKSTGLHG